MFKGTNSFLHKPYLAGIHADSPARSMICNTTAPSSFIACPWCWICGNNSRLNHMIFPGYSVPHQCTHGKFHDQPPLSIKNDHSVFEDLIMDSETQRDRRLGVDRRKDVVEMVMLCSYHLPYFFSEFDHRNLLCCWMICGQTEILHERQF